MKSDLELLRDYTRNKSEESFTALVNRHLNLVYSAAFRQVRSPQLAEEVVQSAFTDLARQAPRLAPTTILSAWLYQVTRRTAINVVRREARRQLREQIACELTAMNAVTNDWERVESLLDEAMHALDDTDRAAVLLRYFENRSLREVGQALGASDNAVQKRISRAVERLRAFFSRKGVTVGASGLVIAVSANAVQAAPVGLAATISTASTLAATTLAAHAGIINTITMTTVQKTFIAVTLAAVTGAGVFEAHKASTLAAQVQTLQQQQSPLAEQIQQLQRERDEATNTIAIVRVDNDRLNQNTSELFRLRNEVGLLRRNQSVREPSVGSPSPQAETTANNGPSPEDIGRELGMAVVRGDPGAFDRLLELAKAESAYIRTNSAGLNDTQRSELMGRTLAPLFAAFNVIDPAAVAGNHAALDALVQAMQTTELKGYAVKCVGTIAGNGNDAALEILLNPSKYGIVLSSVVPALQPAADNGNQKAIDALAAVANDAKDAPLWYLTAQGLEKSAGSGNEVAIDALIAMSATTNFNVRNAVVPGLRAAAANQNAKAAAALAAMGAKPSL